MDEKNVLYQVEVMVVQALDQPKVYMVKGTYAEIAKY